MDKRGNEIIALILMVFGAGYYITAEYMVSKRRCIDTASKRLFF